VRGMLHSCDRRMAAKGRLGMGSQNEKDPSR
jgi:hypothetical protein